MVPMHRVTFNLYNWTQTKKRERRPLFPLAIKLLYQFLNRLLFNPGDIRPRYPQLLGNLLLGAAEAVK